MTCGVMPSFYRFVLPPGSWFFSSSRKYLNAVGSLSINIINSNSMHSVSFCHTFCFPDLKFHLLWCLAFSKLPQPLVDTTDGPMESGA